MNLSNNAVLITGGSTGIRLAFAERFARAGSEVLISAQREDKLREVHEELPRLKSANVRVRARDVADAEERSAPFEWATRERRSSTCC